MISGKYNRDYRLETFLDEKGKMRTKAVYCGDNYFYKNPEKNTEQSRRLVGIISILTWIIWFFALVTDSSVFRKFYVVMPYVFIPIPLYYLCCGSLKIWLKKEPFTHEQADHINNRLPGGAMVTVILSGISLIGVVVKVILDGTGKGDILFVLIVILLVAVCLFLYQRSKILATAVKKQDNME